MVALTSFGSQALFDLEATNSELKSDLRDLFITSAVEIDVSASRKAIIIHVGAFFRLSPPLPPLPRTAGKRVLRVTSFYPGGTS